jgi:hypothetical protein
MFTLIERIAVIRTLITFMLDGDSPVGFSRDRFGRDRQVVAALLNRAQAWREQSLGFDLRNSNR